MRINSRQMMTTITDINDEGVQMHVEGLPRRVMVIPHCQLLYECTSTSEQTQNAHLCDKYILALQRVMA